ncbi:MAG TPA: single-stranded-DNA-specific exonuclease RecJ [Steroidobacteraceae bacterium]|nr:single-stranded-DNA-specific exonuclease RecJ [Steroidobacteraceae bacterium]
MNLTIVRRCAPLPAPLLDPQMHPVLQRVYAARGVRCSQDLALSMQQLLPIGTLGGVEAAAELLWRHRQRGELVLIIGDFDADGATSTALFVRALRSWGFAAVDFLVPNRFEFGYGLTPEIVALAALQRPALIVTVDNGISSNAGVAAARAAGIDVLITDHHLPGRELPHANVIVNPNLPGSAFASRALAGVGVAFYVIAALRRLLDARGLLPSSALMAAELLDLVALGTVADVVPFDSNNRILVAQGLARIRAGRCVPGITALLEVARRSAATLVASDLGFAVAPRLNAAGRLTDMSIGIRCLLSQQIEEARAAAQELDALNSERRQIEARMQSEALSAIRVLRDPGSGVTRAGVCLFDAAWHQGVVGLVASRIKERLRRPVIAFARIDATTLRGSARSIPGIHVRDLLDSIAVREPLLIQKFGGHAMAAGVTLESARLDQFAGAFDAECSSALARLGSPDVIETDGELGLEELALPLAAALRAGGPWGPGFPEPLFDGVFRIQSARLVGERHLKLGLCAPEGRGQFDAIAFNFTDGDPRTVPLPSGSARLVYRLECNEYMGERRLQFVIEHVLPA